MIVTIHNVLQADELEKLAGLTAEVEFIDGRDTAKGAAARAKNNQQAKFGGKAIEEIRAIVLASLLRNDALNTFALPLRIMPPVLNRYEAGMAYADHIDRAVMQGPYPVRTDLAMTLFLSAPEQYDGGELAISSDTGAQRFKLPRGALVLYPATTIHRVEAVTRGVRIAAVSWIQSMVREHEKRIILAELGGVRRVLRPNNHDTPEALQVQKIRANLLRMWAEI
jgi:PKHD-type hydroxylase